MKKLPLIIMCIIFSMAGFVYSDIYSDNRISGYWFGNALKDSVAGTIMCDQSQGVAYIGFYSKAKIPGTRGIHACNLAISMDKNGEARMQVIDPKDGHIYNLDLLALAKNNQTAKDDIEEVQSIAELKVKNAQLERRIEELVAEIATLNNERE